MVIPLLESLWAYHLSVFICAWLIRITLFLPCRRLLEEARQRAALTIQCAWRWSRSKKHCELRAIRSSAARVVWHRWRAFSLAREMRNAFMSMQLGKLRVFSIHLQHANNLLIGDVTSSDPYVYIHGEVSDETDIGLRRPSSVSKGRRPSYQGTSPTVCCYRSKLIKRNLNPVWDEKCLLAGISCKDKLMLTIMDKDTFSNDDCLGQVRTCTYCKRLSLFKK